MAKPSQPAGSSPENRLLAALPRAEFDRLTARMKNMTFAVRDVLYQSHGPIPHVYFPRTGVVSMVITAEEGGMIEVGTVGREGMAGVPAILGGDRSATHTVWQVGPCEARRMPVAAFREEVQRDGPFRTVLQRYALALMNQISQSAACNRLHAVEERCARWLLMTQDRVGADTFRLSQEFLATMLGVRRPSVTVAAGALQNAGLISYQHGRITILDRERLEAASCECYQTVRDEYDRLVP
jgi:CRP-like cAMP-binding protein